MQKLMPQFSRLDVEFRSMLRGSDQRDIEREVL